MTRRPSPISPVGSTTEEAIFERMTRSAPYRRAHFEEDRYLRQLIVDLVERERLRDRDDFFLTTEKAAKALRITPREVVALIEHEELGAIKVDGEYRIPWPAITTYERRQALTQGIRSKAAPKRKKAKAKKR